MHDNRTTRAGGTRAFFPKYLKAFFSASDSEHFSPLYALHCELRQQRAPCPMLYACERSEHFFTLYALRCELLQQRVPCPMPYALCVRAK